jgi:hypothetical protein
MEMNFSKVDFRICRRRIFGQNLGADCEPYFQSVSGGGRVVGD